MKYKELYDFLNIYKNISSHEFHMLPLCAAENISSDFVKLPHSSFLQEKYILGGIMEYLQNDNFHGSQNLFDIYTTFQKQCNKMFNCVYSDARTLSGLNAITTVLMALFEIGDTLLITSPEYGGHSSMQLICDRLGLKTIFLPYDYDKKDFDYDQINLILNNEKIKGILVALSDMIEHPHLEKIKLNDSILIYDATQILGLIATKYIENPFEWFSDRDNVILMGATHKTIPGPTCGLIMTQNISLAKKLDLKVNPDYLRNVQLNNIVSLLFALYELEYYGQDYFGVMKKLINETALQLNDKIEIIKTRDNDFSKTHQLWLSVDKNRLSNLEKNSSLLDVSLNVRNRRIYNTQGVRLGFQQIARFNWNIKAASLVAEILLSLTHSKCNYNKTQKMIKELPPKKLHFIFEETITDEVYKILHNCNLH